MSLCHDDNARRRDSKPGEDHAAINVYEYGGHNGTDETAEETVRDNSRTKEILAIKDENKSYNENELKRNSMHETCERVQQEHARSN